MSRGIEVFEALVQADAQTEPVVLCTVIRTAGSTPRKHTTRMMVRAGGSIVGTIGGGRVERHHALPASPPPSTSKSIPVFTASAWKSTRL